MQCGSVMPSAAAASKGEEARTTTNETPGVVMQGAVRPTWSGPIEMENWRWGGGSDFGVARDAGAVWGNAAKYVAMEGSSPTLSHSAPPFARMQKPGECAQGIYADLGPSHGADVQASTSGLFVPDKMPMQVGNIGMAVGRGGGPSSNTMLHTSLMSARRELEKAETEKQFTRIIKPGLRIREIREVQKVLFDVGLYGEEYVRKDINSGNRVTGIVVKRAGCSLSIYKCTGKINITNKDVYNVDEKLRMLAAISKASDLRSEESCSSLLSAEEARAAFS